MRVNEVSAEGLLCRAKSFDVVTIKPVVKHLIHSDQALHELDRVPLPGGTLILSAPNLISLLRPLKGGLRIGFQDPAHISLELPEEWLDLVDPAAEV
jgi:2-polyprenyl-3-methyl-5-hydroxy-6-metoxy-1,4-benzoquinol methylase